MALIAFLVLQQAHQTRDVLLTAALLSLSPATAFRLFSVASQSGLHSLRYASRKLILTALDQCMESDPGGFAALARPELVSLLSHDALQVPDEAAVFLAAVRWATSPLLCSGERTAREVQVPQVTADCVRLSLLSYPQLEQLDQDALVSSCGSSAHLAVTLLISHMMGSGLPVKLRLPGCVLSSKTSSGGSSHGKIKPSRETGLADTASQGLTSGCRMLDSAMLHNDKVMDGSSRLPSSSSSSSSDCDSDPSCSRCCSGGGSSGGSRNGSSSSRDSSSGGSSGSCASAIKHTCSCGNCRPRTSLTLSDGSSPAAPLSREHASDHRLHSSVGRCSGGRGPWQGQGGVLMETDGGGSGCGGNEETEDEGMEVQALVNACAA
ncbi:MAG: hypothetical protein WDW36_008260 [Sanguina aurantia]